MEKEQEYKVNSSGNLELLQKDVNRDLEYGWRLAGGISVTVRIAVNKEAIYQFFQALVRDKQ